MPPTRVIVTRPAHDAAHWVEQLTQSGFHAAALPLIEIAAASDPGDALALQTAWKELDTYAACMFVSGNAVAFFFKQYRPLTPILRAQAAAEIIASYPWPLLPERLRFLAPGPGTAAALRAVHVAASQIDSPPPDAAQFDSSALWDVMGARDWRGLRVLLVRGRSQSATRLQSPVSANNLQLTAAAEPARDWLAQRLHEAGASVDLLPVYERRAPSWNAAQIESARAASCDGSVWLFSSSEAVANLCGASALTATDWRSAKAIATHPKILAAVRGAGFGTALASRPALPDIVQALRSIESTAHES